MTSFQQPSWNLKLKKREWSSLGSLARLSHPTPTSKCPIMQLWELIIEWNDVWNWKHLKCIVLVPTRSKLYRRWRRIRILSEKQPAIQTRWHPAKLWKCPRFTNMCLLLLYLSQVEADMQGIDRSTQMNLSRKSLHEISKTPQFKQGHGIGYTFSSYAKNVPLNSQLFWDLKEILFKISHIKFTGFNRSVW